MWCGTMMPEVLRRSSVSTLSRHPKSQEKPIIYVSFDRSPRNLLDKLGPLADYKNLVILDCFTYGRVKARMYF